MPKINQRLSPGGTGASGLRMRGHPLIENSLPMEEQPTLNDIPQLPGREIALGSLS